MIDNICLYYIYVGRELSWTVLNRSGDHLVDMHMLEAMLEVMLQVMLEVMLKIYLESLVRKSCFK